MTSSVANNAKQLVLGVITVNLNNAVGLETTIKSFGSQDYLYKKLFIVDGNSTDGSLEIISRYQHLITKYIVEEDSGIYDAMNKGFDISKFFCDYVLFLNTSDLFYSDKALSDLSICIKDNKILPDLVVGKALYNKKSPSEKTNDFFLSHKISYVNIGSPFCHQACFFRVTSLPNPPYDPSFRIAGDYALFCHLYKVGISVLYTNVILTLFDPSGISSKPRFGHITRKEIYSIRKHILKQPSAVNVCIGLYIYLVGIMRDNFRPLYLFAKYLLRLCTSS